MIVNPRLAGTVLLIAAGACSRSGTLGGPVGAPTASELAHATYSGVMNEPVTLISGRWEGEPYVDGGASRPAVGLVEHFILLGDLNGDGLDEAVTLLWESSGGSGNRLYLAVMSRREEDVENLGTALIGDRVQIRSGTVDEGRITLDIVRAGPEDAACCPTEKALVTWTLSGDGLSQIADETIGTLSLADLGGREWVLRELGHEQPLPEKVEISLVFQDDKVSGNSGCNNYFAGVVTPRPGELEFNGMGATRMACPEPVMDLERRYLSALAGASGYRFLAGRLVLTCETDEGPQVLVFTPARISHRVSS
jgi:heat shock protein HslJ